MPGPVPALSDRATIYVAKKIVTMDDAHPLATAVAVRGGRFAAVGSLDEVRDALGETPYDLDERFVDKVITAGLIDQHLHPLLGALTLAVEVIAPEDWVLPGRTIPAAHGQDAYRSRLEAAEKAMPDPTAWFFSWGYHPLFHGPLDRAFLDSVSADRPVLVWHRSCHEMFLNTAALRASGIVEGELGGHGLASEQCDFAAGHFYEKGLELVVGHVLPKLATVERLRFGLTQLVTYLHQSGVTAICEPGALVTPQMFGLFQQILGAESTPFYTYFIPDGRALFDDRGEAGAIQGAEQIVAMAPSGKVSFLDRQIKLFCDGAIISQLMQMEDGYLDGHQGQWIMPPDAYEAANRLFWNAGWQIHTHVNGDLGLETVVSALERRMRESPRDDHRAVIVHFACSREDQVERIKNVGALVSANPYYPVGFADMFGQVGLGPERADEMVRAASVVRRGIPYSLHSDLPMAPARPLFLAQCAAARVTPSGRVAAPEQRIDVMTALRGVTIEAAYSWRREDDLGSVRAGKIANLTVLDEDPLAVDPSHLGDIAVCATMFEGRVFPVTEIARGASGTKTAPTVAGSLRAGMVHEHGDCWACRFTHVIARTCFPEPSLHG